MFRVLAITAALTLLSVYGASSYQAGVSNSPFKNLGSKLGECREIVLTLKPGWALTGSFTRDSSQLLVVDALHDSILRYSRAGESLGTIGEPIKSTLQNLLPVAGKTRGEDFIVEISDGFMVLNKDLRPVMTKRLISSSEEGWTVGGIWQWEPVGKTDIVAFVDLVKNGSDRHKLGNWKSSFVRFPLEHPEQVKTLKSFPLTGNPNKAYFRSSYYYITSIGETAYFLSMDKGLTLFKNERGKATEDISYLLPQSLHRPDLPDWGSADEYVKMMKKIEKESMPVGLYGWNNSLYVLYRSPARNGEGTRWALYSIDPSGKNPISQTELPIQANHVTVVPGLKDWAFLEKDPVLSYGVQNIPRLLFIPAEMLKTPLRPSLCYRSP